MLSQSHTLPGRASLRVWTVVVSAVLLLDGSVTAIELVLNGRHPVFAYYRLAFVPLALLAYYSQRYYLERVRPLEAEQIEAARKKLINISVGYGMPAFVMGLCLFLVKTFFFLPIHFGQGVLAWPLIGPVLSYILMYMLPIVVCYFFVITAYEVSWLRKMQKQAGTSPTDSVGLED